MRILFAAVLIVFHWAVAHAENPVVGTEVSQVGGFMAFLISPTTRYAHGALGDDVEAAGFAVKHHNKTKTFVLPETQVFEDLRVRLHDLDGDSIPEAIIIRSDLAKGASIAVYSISGADITLQAASDFIGQPNRWLNIVGFGDFTGSGKTMIAAVVTPHLTGSLRLYDIVGGQLLEISRIDGFTNHVNGTTDLDLAQLRDGNGDGVVDIDLPALDLSARAVITFKGGNPHVLKMN